MCIRDRCNGVLTEEQYKTAKKYGFQDKTIKRLAQVDKLPVDCLLYTSRCV